MGLFFYQVLQLGLIALLNGSYLYTWPPAKVLGLVEEWVNCRVYYLVIRYRRENRQIGPIMDILTSFTEV